MVTAKWWKVTAKWWKAQSGDCNVDCRVVAAEVESDRKVVESDCKVVTIKWWKVTVKWWLQSQ